MNQTKSKERRGQYRECESNCKYYPTFTLYSTSSASKRPGKHATASAIGLIDANGWARTVTPAQIPALVIFPGALGDFVCFLPTLLALRERHGALSVVAKPSLLDLLEMPSLRRLSIDRREIADLFADSVLAETTRQLLAGHATTYTWSGWGNQNFANRLRAATGGSVEQFRFRAMQTDEHAADYYARCAGVVAMPIDRRALRLDVAWLTIFRREHQIADRPYIVIHPGSGSAAKNWTGFAELVRHREQEQLDAIVLVRGPTEVERAPTLPAAILLETPSLPQLAALVHGARLYVGNDSGVSHLAGAVGATGIVLFGPSDPVQWAPRGKGMKVLRATGTCTLCSTEIFCVHRLPVEIVASAVSAELAPH